MRGKKVFNDIISEQDDKGGRKGRNDDLLELRNTCMIARYYYYCKFRSKSFEEILRRMANEFFITPIRISRIIQENIAAIKEMKEKEVSVYHLQATWPQFKW